MFSSYAPLGVITSSSASGAGGSVRINAYSHQIDLRAQEPAQPGSPAGIRAPSSLLPASGLRSAVVAAVKIGAKIVFTTSKDPQVPPIDVHAEIPQLGTRCYLGFCSLTQRIELEGIIAETKVEMAEPSSPREPTPTPAAKDPWLSIVARRLGDLRADWTMMTEDARAELVAQIHAAVISHM